MAQGPAGIVQQGIAVAKTEGRIRCRAVTPVAGFYAPVRNEVAGGKQRTFAGICLDCSHGPDAQALQEVRLFNSVSPKDSALTPIGKRL